MKPIEKIREWEDHECFLLNGMLDEIIPESEDGRLPGAGKLGIANFLAQRVQDTEKLDTILTFGLTQCTQLLVERHGSPDFYAISDQERETLMHQLEANEPAFFSILVKYTYMGYCTHPIVLSYFGLSDSPPHPNGYDLPNDDPDQLAKLLEPVIKRGSCYRDC